MKTIEEAAREAGLVNRMAKTNIEEAFKKGVAFAQRWIPVEECMPENHLKIKTNPLGTMQTTDQVLVRTSMDGIKLKKRVCLNGKWSWAAGIVAVEWRPIELK